MSRTITMPDGTVVTNVPDDMAQFGEQLPSVMSGLLASRQFIIDRLPEGMRRGPLRELPPGILEAVEQASPIATGIGEAAFPVAAGMAMPAQGAIGVALQGAIQGGLEALDDEATFESARNAALLGSGGQVVGNATSRVLSGIARGVRAARSGSTPLITTSPAARLVAETGLGRGQISKINAKVIEKSIGRTILANTDDGVTAAALRESADNISSVYDRALSTVGPVDTTEAFLVLDDIPAAQLPGKRAIMERISSGQIDGRTFKGMHKTLREISSKMRSGRNPEWAPEIDRALKKLNQAAVDAGADPGLLGQANQRWKVLATLEEIPEVWIDEKVPARKLATRLGRKSAKGFGTAAKREGADAGLLPEVRDLLQVSKQLAADASAFGDSGTAGRVFQQGTSGGAAVGLATGAIEPTTAAGILAGQVIIPPLAAAASVGQSIPQVGGAVAGAAQLLNEDEP